MTTTSEPGAYVEVSVAKHTIITVNTNLLADSDVINEIRFDGLVQLRAADGELLASERCVHLRGGLGAIQIHPHRQAPEAIDCARVVAGNRHPGTEIREAEETSA